jgi:hypothetical protein
MNKTDPLDEKIRSALDVEAPEGMPVFEEPSPLRQFFQIFRTGRRQWNLLAVTITFIFLVFAVTSAVVFFDKSDWTSPLASAAVFIVSMNVILAIKVYVWLEMQKLSLVREVKRLELQVAHLRKEVAERGQ